MIKRGEFIQPNNVHEIDSNTNEPEVEVIPEVINDVSDVEFTIICYCTEFTVGPLGLMFCLILITFQRPWPDPDPGSGSGPNFKPGNA